MEFETDYAIRRLIHRCAELQDQGRIEEVAALFRFGEIVLAGVGEVFRGEAGALEVLRRTVFYDANGVPADPVQVYATSRAMQLITNVEVFYDSSGETCATSRFLVLQQRGPCPHPVIGGRYVDSFTRLESAYWFRRRVAEVHLLGDSVGYLTVNPWTA